MVCGPFHQVYCGTSFRAFYIFPLLLIGQKGSSMVVGKQPGRVFKADTEVKHYYMIEVWILSVASFSLAFPIPICPLPYTRIQGEQEKKSDDLH